MKVCNFSASQYQQMSPDNGTYLVKTLEIKHQNTSNLCHQIAVSQTEVTVLNLAKTIRKLLFQHPIVFFSNELYNVELLKNFLRSPFSLTAGFQTKRISVTFFNDSVGS